tara:strand:+ start:214 stop:480 length:267 start_codon:yes stop_codon:yes gene_type:complete
MARKLTRRNKNRTRTRRRKQKGGDLPNPFREKTLLERANPNINVPEPLQKVDDKINNVVSNFKNWVQNTISGGKKKRRRTRRTRRNRK